MVRKQQYPQRILLLTQWHEPEPVTRQAVLADGLVKRGYDVTVLTTFPSYPRGKTYPGYRQRLVDVSVSMPRVIRVPSVPSRSLSLLHRGVSYASFAISASILGVPKIPRPDIIWVYQPPPSVALPALLAKCAYRAPVVHEIQDMWPDTLVASGLRKDGRLTSLIHRAMRWILARVDHVVVISPGFAKLLQARGTPTDRITVIPNWSVAPERAAPRPDGSPSAALRILYAGNVGPGQRLDVVVDAIAATNDRLKTSASIELAVLGDGPALAQVREHASLRGVALEVMERVAPEVVPVVASEFDALLVNLAADPVFRTTIPSKLITYLAIGKPILAGLGGDGADIVRTADAGIAFEPEDHAGAVAALTEFAMTPVERRMQMGANARAAFESDYQADRLLNRYDELFQALIVHPSRS